MARPKHTTKSVEGRNRLLRETNVNVLEMVRMREYYAKLLLEALRGTDGKVDVDDVNKLWAKEFEIISAMLAFQVPKLQAIEVSADESNVIKLLTDIRNESLKLREPKQLKESKSETDNDATASQTS